MPDYNNGNRAQQQLRDLGNATRHAARELNRSSPTAAEGNRILREYERRVAQTLQPPPAPQKPLPQAPKKKWSWFPWTRKTQKTQKTRKIIDPIAADPRYRGFWWG